MVSAHVFVVVLFCFGLLFFNTTTTKTTNHPSVHAVDSHALSAGLSRCPRGFCTRFFLLLLFFFFLFFFLRFLFCFVFSFLFCFFWFVFFFFFSQHHYHKKSKPSICSRRPLSHALSAGLRTCSRAFCTRFCFVFVCQVLFSAQPPQKQPTIHPFTPSESTSHALSARQNSTNFQVFFD